MKQSVGAKTILFPTPVFIVGTYDENGRPNLMNVAWGGICSSEPPSVAISVRPGRYTHENITRSQAFTVNIPSADHVAAADYVGMHSGRTVDKFAATGLTAVRSELVDAPCVEEFPLVLECKVIHTFELGAHTQFVGHILDVKAEQDVLDEKGSIDVAKVSPFTFSPSDGAYYRIGAFLAQAFSVGRKHG
jgi:flavin reductase (DIM6/NTAB) family NADH-FMN oxidoreductase RutF